MNEYIDPLKTARMSLSRAEHSAQGAGIKDQARDSRAQDGASAVDHPGKTNMAEANRAYDQPLSEIEA